MSPTPQPKPPHSQTNADTPDQGGGLSVVQYWAEQTLTPEGPQLWQTLMHKSAVYLVRGHGWAKGWLSQRARRVDAALHEKR
ncbi:hypothetical protein [Leptolyngbya sp. O-77]|uniref:hypothetical protein n=1 Tax=Leptolyngbya sp. O-77 TaxID=1080068 RepID=UPI00074D30FF|nr:hypothetical protein [Leptolyngbya sp. O-77]BAU44173.1 hypothetical protein O77CONTIG1_04012 [Leptolyngbya sp. O-77]